MKDLYRAAGLEAGPATPQSEVDRRLRELRQPDPDVVAVLGNPARRGAYDRTWNTLMELAELRARLGMAPQTGGWAPRDARPNRGTGASGRRFAPSNVVGWGVWVILGLVVVLPWLVDDGTPSSSAPSTGTEATPTPARAATPAQGMPADFLIEDRAPLTRWELCELQERLSWLGYYTGTVDGLHGPLSRQAVRQARHAAGLAAGAEATRSVLQTVRRASQTSARSGPYRPMPAHGTVFETDERVGVAPFTVHTTPGSGGYIVKLKTADDQRRTVRAYFVRAGSPLNVDVPLGRYRLEYAQGQQWVSYRCAFGMQTVAATASRTLEFIHTSQGITGYTVELYRQRGGNLPTTTLTPAAF